LDPTNQLAVEWVEIDRLFPNPANPRHNDQAVEPVADSLRRFGWQQPLVAKPSGEVVAGNTRLKAARRLGMGLVPVVRFIGSDLDATAYGIADNRTGEIAAWDEDALRELLSVLQAEDALEGVGYTDAEIAALLAGAEDGEEDSEAEGPEPEDLPEEPVTKPGDLWVLGEHRLLCADAREPESYRRLLGDARVDLVWTDPPYGVAYVGKTEDALRIQNDELSGDDLERFLEAALTGALRTSKSGATWYIAGPAGPNFLPFAKVLDRLGVWRQTLVWVKDALVLGRSDYHYRHEAIFYGWTPGAAHREPPDRTRDTVWEFDRPKASRDHPTSKPVGLVAHAIRMSSAKGELVLDCFAGSGTHDHRRGAHGTQGGGAGAGPALLRRDRETLAADDRRGRRARRHGAGVGRRRGGEGVMDEENTPDEEGREPRPEPKRTLPRYTIHELEMVEDPLGRKFYYTPDGRPVCGRRRKRANAVIEDEACMAAPTGYGPCRVHGAGGGHPMTAGGRYSKTRRSCVAGGRSTRRPSPTRTCSTPAATSPSWTWRSPAS